MKPEEYNPKAREAFGKTLVDVGVSIFKATILLFTVVPLALIIKTTIELDKTENFIVKLFGSMSESTYFTFATFLIVSFIVGHVFRAIGLRHIHDSEKKHSKALVTGDLISAKDDNKEKYERWENYRVIQLSFSINLFLGFSVASLAYLINLKLSENDLDPNILVCIIILWSFSTALGVIATISRLLDFRHTVRKYRYGSELSSFLAEHLGAITWGMFWGQILTYVVGAYYFISSVIST